MFALHQIFDIHNFKDGFPFFVNILSKYVHSAVVYREKVLQRRWQRNLQHHTFHTAHSTISVGFY